MTATTAPFDPFENTPGFQYPIGATVRAHYPLSPKSKVPDSIFRPNYARESVSGTFWAYWEVSKLILWDGDSR